jgi:CheY-like chemotaxis protein
MMPGDFDGLEVCRRLRLDPSTRTIPVLIVTAATDADSREEAMRAGATGFFTKPFSPFALLNELERVAPPSGLPPKK